MTDGGIRRGVRGLFAGHRLAMVVLGSLSLAGGALEALFLVVVTRVAFAITAGHHHLGVVAGRTASVWVALGVALVLVLARIACAVLVANRASRLAAQISAGIRADLSSAYLQATWAAQHGERTGRLQELLTTFAGQGSELVMNVMAGLVAVCSLTALLVLAVLVDPLASLAVIAAVIALGTVLRPLRGAIRRQAGAASGSGMEFATSVTEISQLGMEMHVFNVQPQAEAVVLEHVSHLARQNQRLMYLRALNPAVYTGLAYLAVVGALAVVNSIETSGVTAVGAVMLVMLRSLSYGQQSQTAVASVQATLPFVDLLDDELQRYRASAVVDGGAAVGTLGPVTFHDVDFRYEVDVPVLRGVSATIEPNEIVGIVGPSGSGKSTFVQLLLGLRDPSSGVVLADGRDIRTLAKAEWARSVTFVPQQAHLIAGSVADNIRFFRAGVTDTDIERAATLANLHVDVMGWADGYRHQVGEQGSHLSGGQAQRLTIARALVEQPQLLVLDEPTSSLDVRSEALIRDTMSALRDHMAIVVIAHRLSTLDVCDRIMVIQDGEVKAFDTPQRLALDNDFYREVLALSGLR